MQNSRLIKQGKKLMAGVVWFISLKSITAIKDGLIMTMPLTVVGSIFLLLGNLPIPGYSDFMVLLFGLSWRLPLNQVVGSTFDILALAGSFGIAYSYAKNDGYPDVLVGILSMVAFFIINDHFIILDASVVNGVVSKEFLGGKGIVGAIIVGLIVGKIYIFCLKNRLIIKLPEQVPPGVSKVFTALIPAFFVMLFMMTIFILSNFFFNSSLMVIIYNAIQTPLQGITSSLLGFSLITLLISLLWWCGIHGAALVSGVMGPILLSNSMANQAIYYAGDKVVAGVNGFAVGVQSLDQYVTVTGSGLTIGLVLAMAFAAKSSIYRKLGRLSLIPSIFNINEPVIFATPIIFNPLMLLPFILAPLLSAISVYLAVFSGFLPAFGAVVVPWTTPIIIGGFLVGGWQGAVMQCVTLLISFFVYYPFFRIADRLAFATESSTTQPITDKEPK